MHYGESDEVVPVYIARLPESFHKMLGSGSTHAVSAGVKADHRAIYTYSVIEAKPWCDGFLKKKAVIFMVSHIAPGLRCIMPGPL
jgi:hypothetical protein